MDWAGMSLALYTLCMATFYSVVDWSCDPGNQKKFFIVIVTVLACILLICL